MTEVMSGAEQAENSRRPNRAAGCRSESRRGGPSQARTPRPTPLPRHRRSRHPALRRANPVGSPRRCPTHSVAQPLACVLLPSSRRAPAVRSRGGRTHHLVSRFGSCPLGSGERSTTSPARRGDRARSMLSTMPAAIDSPGKRMGCRWTHLWDRDRAHVCRRRLRLLLDPPGAFAALERDVVAASLPSRIHTSDEGYAHPGHRRPGGGVRGTTLPASPS